MFVVASAASASRRVPLAGGGALPCRDLTGHRGRLVTALVAGGMTTACALRMAASSG